MLILTDDGPLNCDNANPAVRDMRTGRPPMTPAQLARDDKRLIAMVRQWADSKLHTRDSSRSTSKDTKMPRFNAAALFQRPEPRSGEAFADYIAERTMRPLDLWKKKLRDASRRVSRHGFDSAPDHEEGLKHLQRMENHINARGGTTEFDPAYLGQCFKAMLQAMGGTEEDDDAEDNDPDQVTDPSIHGGPPNVRAKDHGKNPDHRKDFNDITEGGADSVYGFDADRLFQRSSDR